MTQNIGAAQVRSLADEFLLEELFSLETCNFSSSNNLIFNFNPSRILSPSEILRTNPEQKRRIVLW